MDLTARNPALPIRFQDAECVVYIDDAELAVRRPKKWDATLSFVPEDLGHFG